MTAAAAEQPRCQDAPVPPAGDLSYDAYYGWACYACGKPLTAGAVLRGRAEGRQGKCVLDVDVWACP